MTSASRAIWPSLPPLTNYVDTTGLAHVARSKERGRWRQKVFRTARGDGGFSAGATLATNIDASRQLLAGHDLATWGMLAVVMAIARPSLI